MAAMEVFNNAEEVRAVRRRIAASNETGTNEVAEGGNAAGVGSRLGGDTGVRHGDKGGLRRGVTGLQSDFPWFNKAVDDIKREYADKGYLRLILGNHPIMSDDMPADDIRMATDPAGWLAGKYEEKIKFSAELNDPLKMEYR